jgi:GntR family transcriptional regulator, histidine utilization repressor
MSRDTEHRIMTLASTLARNDSTPSLHQRILSDIEGRILSGEWPPGYRIPFEMELAGLYDCSRMTVNKALSQLAKSGLIERRKKSGSFVTQPHAQSAVLEIRDIKAEVQSLGLAYDYELLRRDQRRANGEERERLDLRAGSLVLALQCRHYAGKSPFSLEERLINLSAVPEAAKEGFEKNAPGPWLLERVPWSAAEHRIMAVGADARVADALHIPEGTACLQVERRTRMNGAYVTLVKLTYPGQAFELVANFAPSQS